MLNLTADGNRILSANGPRRQEIYWQMGPFPRESGPGVIGNRPYSDRKVTVRLVTSGKPTARRARWWVRGARSEVGGRGAKWCALRHASHPVPRTYYLTRLAVQPLPDERRPAFRAVLRVCLRARPALFANCRIPGAHRSQRL